MPAKSRVGNQFYATFCANLLCLGYGLATGWTSAAVPLLKSAQTPLKSGPITSYEASIIGSILTIGGVVGTLIFGYAANRIGRKKSIFLMAFPQIFGWILMFFAQNAWMLILFRFLAGIAAGGVLTVISGYTTEISADRVRGLLGSTLRLFFGVGVLLAYVFGAVLPYHIVPWASLSFSVIFLYCFWYVPETPLHLLKNRKFEEAEFSLRYYRKSPGDDKDEALDVKVTLESMLETMNADESSKFSLSDLKARHPRKAILYGLVLMALNQFCGVFAMMNFTATIFNESGSTLSPNVSSIIAGATMIIGAVLCTFLVEKAGRKMLFAISAFGISLGLGVMSLYTFATSRGVNLSDYSWIPMVALSFVNFIYNWGVNTLPFLYVSEIVPRRTKAFTMTFCLTFLFIFATIVIQLLSTLITNLGMHGTMLFFALCTLSGAVFVVIFLPETKGRNYDEISKIMES